MVIKTKHNLALIALISLFSCFSIHTVNAQKFGFKEILKNHPDEITVFCVPNSVSHLKLLEKENISIKYKSSNWIFINAAPSWIDKHKKEGSLSDYYFEFAPPVALGDSARAAHFVNEVHAGDMPLGVPYTGKGVIIGVVDQGIDFLHEDFLDENGKTRVLRYWDHTVSGPNPPTPYGYGQLWDSTAINNGTCTSTETGTAHGSTVAGMAVGDGSANGSNKGMAPDANIVIVETNFNLPNWSLSIADACDYIFKVADSLGMPAIVNLSLGSYLGSHDGNDPATEYIESLVDEKPGRIVVCAAGNSGLKGKYHQQSSVSLDTNFVWFLNNPSASLGANTIFFDLWSDVSDATYDFALGADTPGPSYDFRGRTNFHGAQSSIGVTIFDTIWNGTNRIATFEAYTELIDGAYHLQMVVTNVDSTNYLYRFETKGSGKYDLWSGAWLGFNDMVSSTPTPVEMPAIIYYKLPDAEQTIVSAWNCSEKIVSVGNVVNRSGHIDNNGNPYVNADPTPPGKICPKSSVGPTRHNLIKPDISAAGEVSLTAGPLWALANPIYNSLIDSGGMHIRNGGTSMASPVVAGIAGLYLERCRYATYNDFLTDIKNTAIIDSYTGLVPNNNYGFGKINAFLTLQETTLPIQPIISINGSNELTSTTENQYQWFLNNDTIIGENAQTYTPQLPFGDYTVLVINNDGCTNTSDPITITAGLDSFDYNPLLTYPNPVSDVITIKTDLQIENIVWYNSQGQIIQIPMLNGYSYNVKGLTKGTYFIEIKTKNEIFRSKFVRID
jgi:hypothetical protein